MRPTHGTQLRHLIELLDGAVGAAYEQAGLNYRPRYTPVMRLLMRSEAATIGQIAENAGITQPSATQTVALMRKDGLVSVQPGANDARQKVIKLSQAGRDLIPALTACWAATAAASATLEAELPFSLSDVLDATIQALAAKPFGERIAAARMALGTASNTSPTHAVNNDKDAPA